MLTRSNLFECMHTGCLIRFLEHVCESPDLKYRQPGKCAQYSLLNCAHCVSVQATCRRWTTCCGRAWRRRASWRPRSHTRACTSGSWTWAGSGPSAASGSTASSRSPPSSSASRSPSTTSRSPRTRRWCAASCLCSYYISVCTSYKNVRATGAIPVWAESNARVDEVVRVDLQQPLVREDFDHPVPQQDRPLQGEDPALTAHYMLPRIQRYNNMAYLMSHYGFHYIWYCTVLVYCTRIVVNYFLSSHNTSNSHSICLTSNWVQERIDSRRPARTFRCASRAWTRRAHRTGLDRVGSRRSTRTSRAPPTPPTSSSYSTLSLTWSSKRTSSKSDSTDTHLTYALCRLDIAFLMHMNSELYSTHNHCLRTLFLLSCVLSLLFQIYTASVPIVCTTYVDMFIICFFDKFSRDYLYYLYFDTPSASLLKIHSSFNI